MILGANLLEALPVAVYTTDADGRITFYNEAAAELWGDRPKLGTFWCGSWRLFWPDGRPMPHDECPMAVTLKERRLIRGAEAILERPDGTRVPFIPYPTLLKDPSGEVNGAINLLVDIGERKQAEFKSSRLASIVACSDDAIISKTLDGRITSWNSGATHIFGYEPAEMIGEFIKRIIPPELHPDEDEILAKLRRGERIDHFETVRVAKDGRRIDVSLTVSPLRNKAGQLIGASKVARDISERKRKEEMQRLLFHELNHRVKNMLTVIQAIASQSLRKAASPEEFVASFSGRIQTLARTHDLLVQGEMKGADVAEIVRQEVMLGIADGMRISLSGPSVMLNAKTTAELALVLHELATNARKYGALSVPTGKLSIKWRVRQPWRELVLEWKESGVPKVIAPMSRGFGTTLIQRSLTNGGESAIQFGSHGVVCRIRLRLHDQGPQSVVLTNEREMTTRQPAAASNLQGKRVLLIEDEPLIAMEIGSQLKSAGCEVVGLAETVESARRLIADMSFDAALVDANLAGSPVGELVAALMKKDIPFTFATGYGRDALPLGFRDAHVLTKPFSQDELFTGITNLLRDRRKPPDRERNPNP